MVWWQINRKLERSVRGCDLLEGLFRYLSIRSKGTVRILSHDSQHFQYESSAARWTFLSVCHTVACRSAQILLMLCCLCLRFQNVFEQPSATQEMNTYLVSKHTKASTKMNLLKYTNLLWRGNKRCDIAASTTPWIFSRRIHLIMQKLANPRRSQRMY